MNCPEYLSLPPQEQCALIGKVVHCLQNDSGCFTMMTSMVRCATEAGLFNNVKIGEKEIAAAEMKKQSTLLTQFEAV